MRELLHASNTHHHKSVAWASCSSSFLARVGRHRSRAAGVDGRGAAAIRRRNPRSVDGVQHIPRHVEERGLHAVPCHLDVRVASEAVAKQKTAIARVGNIVAARRARAREDVQRADGVILGEAVESEVVVMAEEVRMRSSSAKNSIQASQLHVAAVVAGVALNAVVA